MADQEWLQSYQQRIDEIGQRAQRASADLAEISATATSKDNAVSVTVNPSGALQDLSLGKSTERMSADKLGRLILQTAQQAQAEAGKKVQEAMRPLLGQTEAMDFLRSQLAADPDAEAGGSRQRRDADDGDGQTGGILR